jgi:hypothetical protein
VVRDGIKFGVFGMSRMDLKRGIRKVAAVFEAA